MQEYESEEQMMQAHFQMSIRLDELTSMIQAMQNRASAMQKEMDEIEAHIKQKEAIKQAPPQAEPEEMKPSQEPQKKVNPFLFKSKLKK